MSSRPGIETVQIYLSDTVSSLPRPPQELKKFARVSLKPGEEKTLSFILTEEDLSFYDDTRKAWRAETGEFEIRAGSSSRDIRLTRTFTLVPR